MNRDWKYNSFLICEWLASSGLIPSGLSWRVAERPIFEGVVIAEVSVLQRACHREETCCRGACHRVFICRGSCCRGDLSRSRGLACYGGACHRGVCCRGGLLQRQLVSEEACRRKSLSRRKACWERACHRGTCCRGGLLQRGLFTEEGLVTEGILVTLLSSPGLSPSPCPNRPRSQKSPSK